MAGSPPSTCSEPCDMRRLHRFLAARAHLRAALLSIRLGRAYLDRDDFYRKDDIAAAEELLEDLRLLAEEHSPPDEHGVEAMVLDAELAAEMFGRYGIKL